MFFHIYKFLFILSNPYQQLSGDKHLHITKKWNINQPSFMLNKKREGLIGSLKPARKTLYIVDLKEWNNSSKNNKCNNTTH